MRDEFDSNFERLMGFPPFEWQKSLYQDYFAKGQVPSALDIFPGWQPLGLIEAPLKPDDFTYI